MSYMMYIYQGPSNVELFLRFSTQWYHELIVFREGERPGTKDGKI